MRIPQGITMFENIEALCDRVEEIMNELSAGSLDADRYMSLMKEQAELAPVVTKYKEYKANEERISDCLSMISGEEDAELKALAKEELEEAKNNEPILEDEIRKLLIPRDPNDDKNVIVEIRAGAGGDEAALFASDLFRMYARYADRRGWKIDTMNSNENGLGGFKEITFMVIGAGAYSRLKYEGGVHRVQRIPITESNGKIQTSTATVAIMPEMEDVEVHIDMNDVKFDVFRASGNGGQIGRAHV